MSAQAQRAYEGYVADLDGQDMPGWNQLPSRLQEAWRAAVAAAIDDGPERGESLTEKQLRLLHESNTARVARQVESLLPPGQGFILLTFDFGGRGSLAYMSNARRDDTIRVLREWLQRQGAL